MESLAGDMQDLKYRDKIEDFQLAFGASRGEAKKLEADYIKPLRKRIRGSDKVAAGQEVAERLNKRTRRGQRKKRGPRG